MNTRFLVTEQWVQDYEFPGFSDNDPKTHPTIDQQFGLKVRNHASHLSTTHNP